MNRRDFLSLSTILPFCTSSLLGEGFANKDGLSDIFTTKDEWATLILARERLLSSKCVKSIVFFFFVNFFDCTQDTIKAKLTKIPPQFKKKVGDVQLSLIHI